MANQDSLTVVQQAYSHFKTGNLPALVAQMGPSVEWHVPDIANSPTAGRRTGQDSVRDFFTNLVTERNAITFEPRQFVAQGDTVVALGDYEWHVNGTGKSFKSDFAHVFKVQDGMITRFQEFMDNAAASEAYRK